MAVPKFLCDVAINLHTLFAILWPFSSFLDNFEKCKQITENVNSTTTEYGKLISRKGISAEHVHM